MEKPKMFEDNRHTDAEIAEFQAMRATNGYHDRGCGCDSCCNVTGCVVCDDVMTMLETKKGSWREER